MDFLLNNNVNNLGNHFISFLILLYTIIFLRCLVFYLGDALTILPIIHAQ